MPCHVHVARHYLGTDVSFNEPSSCEPAVADVDQPWHGAWPADSDVAAMPATGAGMA